MKLTNRLMAMACLALWTATPTWAQAPWRTDTTRRSVPLTEIVSGGPPRDGIPPVDRPRFAPASAVAWLQPREPVLVVEYGGVTKAYPLQILIWHEIVNDEVGDLAVAVTYCPLCNTALVFERTIGGRILDFGTTGRLRQSDLVMYDRETESWWQQATGEAIVGELTGARLRPVPAQLVAWREALALYADLQVLTRETGFDRPYGRNPYPRYDSQRSPISAFFRGRGDPRLPAMERVAGIVVSGTAAAVPFTVLRRSPVQSVRVGDVPIVVWWRPEAASALDDERIERGRDVGSTVVLERRIGLRILDLRVEGEHLVDRQTGSRWDRAGRAVAGPLTGQRLAAVPHGQYFWFAWIAFHPDARLLP